MDEASRDLLGWATRVGWRFLAEVVEEYAREELPEADTSQLLAELVDPLVVLGVPSPPTREFRDKLMFAVAKEYRRELLQSSEGRLGEILRRHLGEWVENSFDEEGDLIWPDAGGAQAVNPRSVMALPRHEQIHLLEMATEELAIHEPSGLRARVLVPLVLDQAVDPIDHVWSHARGALRLAITDLINHDWAESSATYLSDTVLLDLLAAIQYGKVGMRLFGFVCHRVSSREVTHLAGEVNALRADLLQANFLEEVEELEILERAARRFHQGKWSAALAKAYPCWEANILVRIARTKINRDASTSDLSETRNNLDMAYYIYKKYENTSGLANLLSLFRGTKFQDHYPDLSIEKLKERRDLCRQIIARGEDPSSIGFFFDPVSCEIDIGEAYARQAKYQDARPYLESAVGAGRLDDVSEVLARVYGGLGDHQAAISILENQVERARDHLHVTVFGYLRLRQALLAVADCLCNSADYLSALGVYEEIMGLSMARVLKTRVSSITGAQRDFVTDYESAEKIIEILVTSSAPESSNEMNEDALSEKLWDRSIDFAMGILGSDRSPDLSEQFKGKVAWLFSKEGQDALYESYKWVVRKSTLGMRRANRVLITHDERRLTMRNPS